MSKFLYWNWSVLLNLLIKMNQRLKKCMHALLIRKVEIIGSISCLYWFVATCLGLKAWWLLLLLYWFEATYGTEILVGYFSFRMFRKRNYINCKFHTRACLIVGYNDVGGRFLPDWGGESRFAKYGAGTCWYWRKQQDQVPTIWNLLLGQTEGELY